MKQFTSALRENIVTKRELLNKEVSYKAALEGIVLLKNNGCLPLKNNNIALYGSGIRRTVKGGTGSGEVNERHAISIYEGIKNAGFNITTDDWLDRYDLEYKRGYEEWKKGHKGISKTLDIMANPYNPGEMLDLTIDDVNKSNTDTAIYCVSRQAGEGADKKIEAGEFDLSDQEIKNINFMAKSYKNSILVINSGSYMDIKDLDDKVSALIFYCQQGQEGGRAFADIIKGTVSPSAKLTDTWARSYNDIPYHDEFSYRSHDTKNEYYHEDIYVGYRYFDTYKVKPRFPFGFGLSYTDFEIKTKNVEINNNIIKVKVDCKNIGSVKGKEVVQVYVSCPNGTLNKEYKRLVGFNKTSELKPNEHETLEISFDLYSMSSYDELTASYILDKGDYIIRVGNSSSNLTNTCVINLDDIALISKNKNICKLDKDFEILEGVKNEFKDDLKDAIKLSIKAKDIKPVTYKYLVPEIIKDKDVNDILNNLTIKEKIDVLVGEGIIGMMSTKKLFTPGAVGRTTSSLYHKGLINVNLSDGPAGLRLLKESALSKKGKQRLVPGNFLLSFMDALPKWLLYPIMAKKNDERLYQFTTSFPVDTSLAQSWNLKLLEEVGKAISIEMDEYNITYWLAPGMNIHRNPLCGRNFEYFSEDPVLSGKVAAALSRGVESIKGNYVTIKHFACNNQEDNRTFSNSHVKERALREIYLKGFEIAVKEGMCSSLMTSYNLVNGIYTPNSFDLCTIALRCEWGFDGVVMTDWMSTNKGQGSSPKAIMVGNDLIMPGGGYYKKSIYKAYKKRIVSDEHINRACANIIKSILRSNVYTRKNNPIKPEMFE